MPYTGIKSQWEDGDLVFYDNDGNEIARFDEGNSALDITKALFSVQEVTSDGANIDEGVQSVEFNEDGNSSVGATIADASDHQGLFIVKDVSNDNNEDHTLTLTSGTFDGTNNVATLDAADEALVVYFDSNGDGTVVENVGSVGLST